MKVFDERGEYTSAAYNVLQEEAVVEQLERLLQLLETRGIGVRQGELLIQHSLTSAVRNIIRKSPVSGDMAITDPQLQDMMKNDRKIEAIKRYRELTNAGLKESKDAIEAVMDSMPRKVLSHADALDDSQLRDYLKGGFTINAIKRYRELTGSGLLEAKRAIENYIGERK